MGELWQTTLSAIRRGEADWAAIAAYETPIRRFLARRYPQVSPSDRDDLLQDVLIAMRERVVERYGERQGGDAPPFRAFLSSVIRNAVIDRFRRARPSVELSEVVEPDAREVSLLDLEARLLGAVRRVHDRYAHGPEADLELVYVLSGALVDGLSNRAIAKREGLSTDQVKRRLQRVRGEIVRELFAGLLPGVPASEVQRAAELAIACLRSPRKETRLLEPEPHAEAIAAFTSAVREAPKALGSDAHALDLLAGMSAIFQ